MKRSDRAGIAATSRLALVVYRDVAMLSALQQALAGQGYKAILARDLPTALLAITQHSFDAAIVNSSVAESGDGFPLAGIIQRIFPEALVSVVAVSMDTPNFISAINHGVRRVVDLHAGDAEFLVGVALGQASAA